MPDAGESNNSLVHRLGDWKDNAMQKMLVLALQALGDRTHLCEGSFNLSDDIIGRIL